MRASRYLGAVLGGVMAVALAGCGSSASGPGTAGAGPSAAGSTGSGAAAPLSVVTSTNVYGDIVRQIAGDRATVTALISNPDADPHEFEASAHDQLELSRADLVVENGGGYDDFVGAMLTASGRDITVLDAVDISGKSAEKGAELNEHVWYDLPSMITLVDTIGTALGTLDPAGADTFSANAADLRSQIRTLQDTASAIAAAHRGAGVAITEPVPLYLLQACGLRNRTPEEFSEAIEEGIDVPALVLQHTLDLFSGGTVALLVYNEQTGGPQTDRVLKAARSHDIPVVPVTETLPAGQDYQGWMADNLAAIGTALG